MKVIGKYCWKKKLNGKQNILQECRMICLDKFIQKTFSVALYMKFAWFTVSETNCRNLFLEKHRFCFFRIVVCQVGGQLITLNKFCRSAKIGIRERQRRQSLNRVPFPWKYCLSDRRRTVLQGQLVLVAWASQCWLFSRGSRDTPNNFLMLKPPKRLSTTFLEGVQLDQPCKNCKCCRLLLTVGVHCSIVKRWLKPWIDLQLRSLCRRISENMHVRSKIDKTGVFWGERVVY